MNENPRHLASDQIDQHRATGTMSGPRVMLGGIAASFAPAKVHPEPASLIAETGRGIAGYSLEDVAPTFRGTGGNGAQPAFFAELLADAR